MSVRTYDPKAVILVINGIPISGYADGSFISIERDEDSFTKVTGSDGFTSRAKSNNKCGIVTITLLQTSLSNSVLSQLALLDELSNNGVVPVICKDILGTSNYFSATGWIKKPAKAEFSKEITNREWILDLADLSMTTEGNFISA